MNDFNNISAESELKDEMTVQSNEVEPDSMLEAEYESRTEISDDQETEDIVFDPLLETAYDSQEPIEEPYDGGGWAGDGSGTDDLADFGANEADDYLNE